MKKLNRSQINRRDFLKMNLGAVFGLLAGALAAKWTPFWNKKKPGSNVGMKPGRHYKTLAG